MLIYVSIYIYVHYFFNIGCGCGWVVNATLRPIKPGIALYQLYWRLGGPQGNLDVCE